MPGLGAGQRVPWTLDHADFQARTGRYWTVTLLTDKRPESGESFDELRDSEAPAFDWMKPAASDRDAAKPASEGSAATGEERGAEPKPKATETRAAQSVTAEPARPSHASAESAPATSEATTTASVPTESVPSEAAPDGSAHPASPASGAAPHSDPAPTGALNVRPPEAEVQRRRSRRDAVARSKPAGPRVVQVLMAILTPFLLLIAAVRLVASPVFLWIEYYRPGFPGDGYGFSTDDRLTYGSYAVDYLANLAGPRYLGGLVLPSGEHLFNAGEVSHMADVKGVVLSAFGAGIVLLLFFVFAFIGLRKTKGAFVRGLFAGAFVTIGIIVVLALLAALGWEQFFTEFHRIFFANGTWTFRLEDTLIRLFPGQFWVDSALVVGVLVMLVASLLVILCWPTPRRVARREAVQAAVASE